MFFVVPIESVNKTNETNNKNVKNIVLTLTLSISINRSNCLMKN